mmetsp:Transcript_3358/g.11985  ORF Transcript_3358/g.11985 Transcript_3358/m.11985 type:complete len:281 (+) Transcript_3358:1312-2154(+)
MTAHRAASPAAAGDVGLATSGGASKETDFAGETEEPPSLAGEPLTGVAKVSSELRSCGAASNGAAASKEKDLLRGGRGRGVVSSVASSSSSVGEWTANTSILRDCTARAENTALRGASGSPLSWARGTGTKKSWLRTLSNLVSLCGWWTASNRETKSRAKPATPVSSPPPSRSRSKARSASIHHAASVAWSRLDRRTTVRLCRLLAAAFARKASWGDCKAKTRPSGGRASPKIFAAASSRGVESLLVEKSSPSESSSSSQASIRGFMESGVPVWTWTLWR